jgi:hypothetical protein
MGIMHFVVPGQSLAGLIELGAPMGAAWGMFFGGLMGMSLNAASSGSGVRRYAITPESHDVLMVVHAGDHVGEAHEALARQHPRYFLTDVPAVHHDGHPHLAATA